MKTLLHSLLWFVCLCAPAAAQMRVEPLPAWSTPDAWQERPALAADRATLKLTINTDAERRESLRLKTPFAVPEWANQFTFETVLGANHTQVRLFLVVKDAAGKELSFQCKQPFTNLYHGDVNILNSGQQKGRTFRLEVPALFRDDVEAQRTIEPKNAKPQRPFTLLGFDLVGNRQKHHPDQPLDIHFKNFAFLDENLWTSDHAGQFRGEIHLGERDGAFGFTPAELVGVENGAAEIDWELRNDYAGFPIAAGSKTLTLSDGDALALAEKIELPPLPPGTYWVRAHARLRTKPTATPKFFDRDFRLYVIRSQAAATPTVAAADAPSRPFRILPRDGGFVFPAGTTESLRVEINRNAPLAARLVTNMMRTPTKDWSFPAGSGKVELPLAGLAPGAYRLDLELAGEEKLSYLVGIRPAPENGAKPVIPDSVTSHQDAYGAKARSYFPISPMIHSNAWRAKPEVTRYQFFDTMMTQTAKVSRDLEYPLPWSLVEPLPGVFDFEETDRMLDRAGELGLSVVLWPHTSDVPDWMPSIYARTVDNKIFYDFAYHFHGGRLNFSQSPELQKRFGELFRQLARRYASHPALGGYFMCMELPGDAPFMGWIEGGDDLTLGHFRDAMRAQYADVARANQLWGTAFADWNAVTPPTGKAGDVYWRDWMRFRAVGYDRIPRVTVDAIRAYDPKRLIWLYGDFPGIELKLSELRGMGVALANGGSHDAIHPFGQSQIGLAGAMVRTEDHFPGKWTGYFPTVLDASVFSMSYADGPGMNCKAYLFTYGADLPFPLTLDALRKPPYSFDRYEHFIPIWSELRSARRYPVDAVMVLDMEAFLTRQRSMNKNGYWNGIAQIGLYDSRLNFGAAELDTALAHAKLLLLTKDRLDVLSAEKIDRIAAFAKNGGTVALLPDSGRVCFENPTDDFALLKALGFAPPKGEAAKGAFPARPEKNPLLVPGGSFRLDNRYAAGQQPEGTVTAAVFADGQPALSLRKVGKGAAAVFWTQSLSAPSRSPEGLRHAVLGDVGRWAGTLTPLACDQDKFWLNAMASPDGRTVYALVHYGIWNQPDKGPALEGRVTFATLKPGRYRLTEMISGDTLGEFADQDLSGRGVTVKMGPREVRILKAAPLDPLHSNR